MKFIVVLDLAEEEGFIELLRKEAEAV